MLKGLCPLYLQNPLGKEIAVSYHHNPPFSMPSPLGGKGSDFLIIQLLARKIGFIPRFIYEETITTLLSDVSWTLYLTKRCRLFNFVLYRFLKNILS